ncbi:MAG: hypothetical protein A2511_06530 [Deltaproteobacteria bacterium RIFOXYD12_FULL_50_9]|nr:MAG: hypothetical protein A2511_06530 [Deltaproteobacteria bacterium RIFOXYD12_FULL_50_9]
MKKTSSSDNLPEAKQNNRGRWQVNPYIWSFTTYFSEGFPYSIIRTISSVFCRDRGASLEAIGLTSLFGLPWTLKFLWAPQLDEFATKRQWLLATQGLLALLFLLTAFVVPLSWAIQAMAGLFMFGSFLAATHDTAIDGYYLEALDKEGQARFVGYRVMAYRIALMTGTGVIVTIGTTLGWFPAFFLAGMLMTGLFYFHVFYLPAVEKERKPFRTLLDSLLKLHFLTAAIILALLVISLRQLLTSTWYLDLSKAHPVLDKFSFAGWIGILLFLSLILLALGRNKIKALILQEPDSYYAKAFLTFMDRQGIGAIIAFIIFIRTGEFMLSTMVAPFMVDLGVKIHYGWISGGVGLPCSIAGAMLGGRLISRYTLRRMIWPFLFAQNVTNIVYMVLALGMVDILKINTGNSQPVAIGTVNLITVVAVHGFDQFAGGLGTAVLMTFLMRICSSEAKAAHYAIGTGLMSVSGLYAGVLSGFLASWLGYGYFFGVSFLLSIPGMLLVSYLPSAILEKQGTN